MCGLGGAKCENVDFLLVSILFEGVRRERVIPVRRFGGHFLVSEGGFSYIFMVMASVFLIKRMMKLLIV